MASRTSARIFVRIAATVGVVVVSLLGVDGSAASASGSGYINTSGAPAHVRSGPGSGYSVVGSLANKTTVTIVCTAHGTSEDGLYGWSDVWDKISSSQDRWVADALVYTGTMNPVAPACGSSRSALNPYNYPWPTQDAWVADGHGYFEGECTSFAAWAVRADGLHGGRSPDWLGNADMWHAATVSSVAHVGDIAQWDDNRNGAGGAGHVGYVAAVNGDGTIKIYEYNWGNFHRLNVRTISGSAPSRYLRF